MLLSPLLCTYITHAAIPINIGLIVDKIWSHRYPEGVVDSEPNHKLYTRVTSRF